jgi:hypothetical protein
MVEDRLKIDPNVRHVLLLKIRFGFVGFPGIYVNKRKVCRAACATFFIKVQIKPR